MLELREFDNVTLSDSFVLGWDVAPTQIVFRVEFHLEPNHPLAVPPKSGEWACYRRGVIIFRDVARVSGLLKQSEVRSSTDPDGSVDYGNIDSLRVESPGRYAICGDFGEVTIESAAPSLSFESVA